MQTHGSKKYCVEEEDEGSLVGDLDELDVSIPPDNVGGNTVDRKQQEESNDGRAPTMRIKAVRIGRPLKVLSFLATTIAAIIYIAAVASPTWIFTPGWRSGLFASCSTATASSKDGEVDCSYFPTRWVQIKLAESRHPLDHSHLIISSPVSLHASAALHLTATGLACGGFVTLLTTALTFSIALLLTNPAKKLCAYAFVLTGQLLSCLLVGTGIALLILSYSSSTADHGLTIDDVGWATIVASIACCLLLLAFTALAVDRKSEEIVYRELID